eukprot:31471-Pelagococcus_subviridis.AAC.23
MVVLLRATKNLSTTLGGSGCDSSHQGASIECGIWDRPVDALPDISNWPTWGTLREQILMRAAHVCTPTSVQLACDARIKVTHTSSLDNAFAAEWLSSAFTVHQLTCNVLSCFAEGGTFQLCFLTICPHPVLDRSFHRSVMLPESCQSAPPVLKRIERTSVSKRSSLFTRNKRHQCILDTFFALHNSASPRALSTTAHLLD